MTKTTFFHGLVIFFCGVIAGAVFVWQWKGPATVAAQGQASAPDLAAMQDRHRTPERSDSFAIPYHD